MGTGWRRAFCTRDPASTISDKQPRSPSQSPSPSPRSCARLGFLSGGSNPSTPRLRCTTTAETVSQTVTVSESPRVHSKNTTPRAAKSPKTLSVSNPTSPRSPLKLSLFRNSFKFRSSCGICLNSVKTGQGTAIYTAECGHAFHFPCIAAHVRKHGSLVCPVCNATWKDVPLLAAHKNLAPESATQDEDEDPGEFQGFFVNPKNSSSSKSYSDSLQTSDGDSRTVQVKLMPECAVISVSRAHETYALVLKVKAPPPPPPSRSSVASSQCAPIDLVKVLDVGGNMTGGKLHMLKRAMRLVISSLGTADRLSIVAFSATSKRLLPLRRMTSQGQRVAHRIVDRLVIGQGSSVGDALRKATRVLEDRRERNLVTNVILLSDDQEKKIQTKEFKIIFFQLTKISFKINKKSVVVQDLRIQVGFESESVEISAIYSCSGRPTLMSSGAVRMGDLYAEEERELLVELRVPASSGTGAHNHVMTVRCLYKDPATQEIVYGREQGLLVPPPQSSGTRIERLRNLFITTRAIAESRRLVEHSTSAHHLLASARVLLMQSNSASAQEYVRGLEAELAELHWRRQHEQMQVQVQQRRRGAEREVMALLDENGNAHVGLESR
ncbi:hypothetical protein glysoja_021859 [Glycine soja]|nr:hypothetical protein glysoja_021859 [Glycine soja]